MNEAMTGGVTPTDEDLKQLRLLSIGHYVVAALAALLSLILLPNIIGGIAMVREKSGASDPALDFFFGWGVVLFSSAAMLAILGFAACIAVAGRFLRQQRHYVYCFVIAVLACGLMPFGTVLGAFTISILLKDSVKRSFTDFPGTRIGSLQNVQESSEKPEVVDADLEHLRLLSVGHYVVAAFTALTFLFPLLHVAAGVAVVSGKWGAAANDPSAMSTGWLFIVFGSSMVLAGLTFAVGLALAGRFLRRQRHYVFCLVMAGIACMLMPFGTALGILTIIVLVRASVKRRFGRLPAVPVVGSAS